MSKRARITLNIDPEAEEEETPLAAEEETESKHKPGARVENRSKAKPKPPPVNKSAVTPTLSAISIGSVLKVVVVGLAVISAVLLLKRKT